MTAKEAQVCVDKTGQYFEQKSDDNILHNVAAVGKAISK